MKQFIPVITALLCLSNTVFSQTWEWAIQSQAPSWEDGNTLALDSQQNIYIAGIFRDSATFDGITIKAKATAPLYRNFYIVKYNTSKDAQWAQKITINKTNANGMYACKTDKNNNVYILGKADNDTVDFGSIILTNNEPSTQMLFLAKYNSSGTLKWVRSFITNTGNLGDISIDNSGNIIVAGYHSLPLILNDTIINFTTTGGLLIKLDSLGNRKWYTSLPSVSCVAVQSDTINNIYISGINSNDVFIKKYNSNGNLIWSNYIKNTMPQDLAIDKLLNVYVSGNTTSSAITTNDTVSSHGDEDMVLAKFNSNGSPAWLRRAGGTSYDEGDRIYVNNYGYIYIGGDYKGVADFGDISMPLNGYPYGGGSDLYIAKYDSAGNTLWVKYAGNQGPNGLGGLTGDNNDNIFIAATFDDMYGDMNFGGSSLYLENSSTTYSSDPTTDMYLAKINDCNAIISLSGTTLTATAGTSYQWYKNNTLQTGQTAQTYTPATSGTCYAKVTFADGCVSRTHPVYVSIGTGIDVQNISDAVNIYPNPVYDVLHIDVPKQVEIKNVSIIDISGRTVLQQNNIQFLNVSSLQNGIYVLQIETNKGMVYKRIIKN